ncbi:amino acid ABC transporter substrate-binding protein (PAAT family) [Alicyclobacillus sacchari]|uniref:Amino acid ABC transporter substrate-binding protein (PAAT family) n=2 Tax=Alicyclobacillus sacchari TaxID=392010 RepID=A0A4R8LRE9_9BACL|nr:ABC transporter substrate-binding protein [Alicyclobacillus sacchari]TDY50169.1 amino acid ABC transporter substrate-binding protein (PAAT family) [Alicyclobacillus sacchari]
MKKSVISLTSAAALVCALVTGCGTANSSNNTVSSTNTVSNTANTGAASVSGTKTTALGLNAVVDPNAMPKPGQVVIAVDDTYPPMEYTDPSNPNKLIGFDIDLGDALAKYLHEKVVWKPTSFDGIVEGLKAGKYDMVISTLNDTPQREKQIDFVDYMSFGQVIVVKKGHAGNIKTIADLKGKQVGVEIGTTSQDALQKEGGIDVKEYNTFPDAFQDLADGRLAACVVDEVVGRYYVNLQPNNYQIAGKPFLSEPVGIGINKKNVSLDAKVKKAIAQMKKDGTYQKIYTYWFGAQ